MDGVGSQSDASSGHWDVQSVETEAITPADATQIVRTPRKKLKLPDSPSRGTRPAPDEPNGFGNHADALSGHTDMPCVETDAITTANKAESVRTRRIGSRTQDSPETHKTVMPKLPSRWKRVSAGDGDVYILKKVCWGLLQWT